MTEVTYSRPGDWDALTRSTTGVSFRSTTSSRLPGRAIEGTVHFTVPELADCECGGKRLVFVGREPGASFAALAQREDHRLHGKGGDAVAEMNQERALELWEQLRALAREGKAPVSIHLFDGEQKVICFAHEGSVYVVSGPPHPETGFAGEVVVDFDPKTLARLLPHLVLEAHRALGLLEEEEPDDE